MSKQDLYDDDGELPPPYSPSATPSSVSVSSPGTLPSLFSSHLSNLPLRISSAQAARSSARDQSDSETLALLVPHVEDFLSSITAMDPPPRIVEMTMVPEGAVGEDWRFSDEDRHRSVVRIRKDDNIKVDGDQKRAPAPAEAPTAASSSYAFDEWGRWDDRAEGSDSQRSLWWSDMDMARRLARYLQPTQLDRQVVKQRVEHVKEVRKANRWSLFKKPETPPPPPPPPVRRPRDEEEDPTMTVKAEEVTFRRENDMGIWESKTGWGIVVTVKLRT